MNREETIIKFLIAAIGVYLTGMILPGVNVANVWIAIVVSAFIGLLNILLKPLLIILTIPITLVTFGLFLIVINGFMIYLADKIVPGFEVKTFWLAMVFSIVLSIITFLLERIFGVKPPTDQSL
jgi:putative membrane protein